MSNWNQRSRGNYGDRDREPRRDRDGPPQRFPNQGSLWPNERGGPQSPDLKGSFTIADEVLDYILRENERGNEVKLEIACWNKMTNDNRNFLSVTVSIPYKVQMEEQGNPTYRQPRPNFNRRQEERPVRQSYSQQSGRTDRRPPRQDDDFSKGDSMPDFLRDDDDNDAPW